MVIPDSIQGRYFTEIDSRALEGNEEITSVDFSQATRLNFIGFYAFEGCTGLSHELIIPESVSTIREGAFMNCSAIPKVTINANVTEIQRETFRGCTSLESAVIPDSVTEIGILAFANCPNLTYLEIDKRVTNIADSAFYNDPNLCLGVWYDSAAYRYALNENINYILLDGAKLGDANGDDNININDVTAIQRYLAELETLEGIYLHAADANQDGTVDIADATVIQMYLAEYEMEYPIGKVMTQ